MTLRDRIVDAGYAAGWRVVRALPAGTAAWIFRFGADRAARRGGAGVATLAANLRVVVGPEMPEDEFQLLVRDSLRSYARYWCEAFRMPSRTLEQRRADYLLANPELLLEPTSRGQGVVLALAHSGNWDTAGAWVVAMGMPLTTVAERLRPESLYRRFVAYRESLGMEILPLTGGDRPIMEVLAERVKAGAVVPLLADRDFSRRGVAVSFFGRKTRMPAGPAILALQTGAPLYTVSMWYEPDGAHGELVLVPPPPPDAGGLDERVRIMTQTMADHFAAVIGAHPADWHMLAKMFVPERAPTATPARADRSAAPGEQVGA